MLKKSYLIPQREGKPIYYDIWEDHSSEGYLWEVYNGNPFSPDNYERDRLLICLLYSCGVEYFVTELLPKETKETLLQLLQEDKEIEE